MTPNKTASSQPTSPGGLSLTPADMINHFTDPRSRLAPYFLQTSHLVLAAVLAASFLFLSLMPLWHTDVWGHIKFGQWMVEHRRLVVFDENSATEFGPAVDTSRPYINFQWLSQVLMYLTYQAGEELAGGDEWRRMAGGAFMLRTLTAILFTLKLLFLWVAFRRLTDSNTLIACGLVVVAVFSLGHMAALRPQEFGEVCFAAILALLSQPLLTRRAVFAITAIIVIWANLHGSFLVGLVLLGALAAGRAAEPFWPKSNTPPADHQFWRLATVTFTSTIAAAILNPHGPAIFAHIMEMSAHPNVADMDEWKPIWFHMDGMLFYVFVASALLIVATQALSPRWFSPGHLLLVLAFGWQTVMYQRMMSWWTLLVPWIVLPYWAEILKPYPAMYNDPSRRDFYKTCLTALVLWIGLMFSTPFSWLQQGQPSSLDRALSRGTPWRLAAEIKSPGVGAMPELSAALKRAGYPDGQFTGAIFASETQGDFLYYALGNNPPVFLHTHVHLMTPEHWRQGVIIKNAVEPPPEQGMPSWRQILNQPRYRINMLVFEPDLHPALRDQILKSDRAWIVVQHETDDLDKISPKNRRLVAIRNLRPGLFRSIWERSTPVGSW